MVVWSNLSKSYCVLFWDNPRTMLYVSVTALRALKSRDLTSVEKFVKISKERKVRVALLDTLEGIRTGAGLGASLRLAILDSDGLVVELSLKDVVGISFVDGVLEEYLVGIPIGMQENLEGSLVGESNATTIGVIEGLFVKETVGRNF